MFEGNSPISNPAGSEPADLSSVSDLSLTVVNERVVIRDDPTARWRVILVSGVVYGRYSRTDAVSERQVCVQLRLSGLASQAEVVAAFGHVRSTQCRWERLYRQMGLAGLFTQPALGRRSVMPKNVEDAVVTLHGQGCGMRRIAAGLGLTLHQVEGVYKRRHLTPHLRVARDGSLFEDGVLRKLGYALASSSHYMLWLGLLSSASRSRTPVSTTKPTAGPTRDAPGTGSTIMACWTRR